MSVWAADPIRHIVIVPEGTLLQEVAVRDIPFHPEDRLIVAGGTRYRVAEHAAEMVRRLAAMRDVKVSFYGAHSESVIRQMLSGISTVDGVGPNLNELAFKVLSSESSEWTAPSPKDLTRIDSDLSRIVLVESKAVSSTDGRESTVLPAQRSSAHVYGPAQYPFESFEAAKRARETLRPQDYDPSDFSTLAYDPALFPQTREAWHHHQQRLPLIYAALVQGLAVAKPDAIPLARGVANAQARGSTDALIQEGLRGLSLYLEWVTQNGGEVGCVERSKWDPAYRRVADVQECRSKLPVTYAWTDLVAGKCEARNRDGARIGAVPDAQCVALVAGLGNCAQAFAKHQLDGSNAYFEGLKQKLAAIADAKVKAPAHCLPELADGFDAVLAALDEATRVSVLALLDLEAYFRPLSGGKAAPYFSRAQVDQAAEVFCAEAAKLIGASPVERLQFATELQALARPRRPYRPVEPDAEKTDDESLPYVEFGPSDNPYHLTMPERLAITEYTGNGSFHVLNAALREAETGNVLPRFEGQAKRISWGLVKLPDFRGVVFRNTDLPDAELAKHEEGRERTYFPFTSSSRAPHLFRQWAPHRFVIYSAHGKYIAPFSVQHGEEEVLFDANTRFRLLKRVDSGTHTTFFMRELPPLEQ